MQSTDESRTNEANLIEIVNFKLGENFINRKDNLVFFINQQGCPCDSGTLKENDKLLKLEDTIGQARLTKLSK